MQVADPFHVLCLANTALDAVRRRVQNQTLGQRGHTHDPLYRARKLLVAAHERVTESGDARAACSHGDSLCVLTASRATGLHGHSRDPRPGSWPGRCDALAESRSPTTGTGDGLLGSGGR